MNLVQVRGLTPGFDVGATGCESLGDFFWALGCNVTAVELENIRGGVRGHVSFEDRRSVQRALRVTGDAGPLDPRKRPHGRLPVDKLCVSQPWIDVHDVDSDASTQASASQADKPRKARAEPAREDIRKKGAAIQETASPAMPAELTQKIQCGLSAGVGADKTSSTLELLASRRKKLSKHLDALNKLEQTFRKDMAALVTTYNRDAPEGWSIPVAAPSEPDAVADISLQGLPPRAPPSEPPPQEASLLDHCDPAARPAVRAVTILKETQHSADCTQTEQPSCKDSLSKQVKVGYSGQVPGKQTVLPQSMVAPAAPMPAAAAVFPHSVVAPAVPMPAAAAAPATVPSWAERASAGGPCKPLQPRMQPPAPVAQRHGCVKSLLQNFGFISSSKDAADLFFHARDCEFPFERARVGDKVLFSTSTDGQGRRRAVHVGLR